MPRTVIWRWKAPAIKVSRIDSFELKLDENGGTAEKSHTLPEFGQEIEGLTSHPLKDGSELIIFGGRGDENGQSKLYWGQLSDEGLQFTKAGIKGKNLPTPELGPGQRSLADLAIDPKGHVLAAAAMDDGDNGPFRSAIYDLGHLTAEEGVPELDSRSNSTILVPGTKVEGLTFSAEGELMAGSDNEFQGGRYEGFLLA